MRDFFFVHINKTGGTSIWHLLGKVAHHRAAQQIIDEKGREEWDAAYSFAFIRNPYDRAVSLYNYRLKTNLGGVRTNNLSFPSFLEAAIVEQEQPHYNNPYMLGPQVLWLGHRDDPGKILVDDLYSFENFEEEVDRLLTKLLLKRTGPVPHAKKTQHKPWQEYYTGPDGEDVKAMVDLAWMLDFQLLPYKPIIE